MDDLIYKKKRSLLAVFKEIENKSSGIFDWIIVYVDR